MASVKDPLANDVAALVTLPPSWLAAERAALAACLGAPPPIHQALPRVRTALAASTGLPLADLESPRLTAALADALRTPGATPEGVAALVGAARPDPESNPIGGLVRAARQTARQLASDAEGGRTGEAEDWEQLKILDSAVARQRQLRLAHLETTTDGPITGLLGPAPAHPAGLRPWRRAAATLLDYRDAAGLFDTDRGEADPWVRALGSCPKDIGLAAHHDTVRAVVAESRAAVLLAEVARHLPAAPARPGIAVAALAERPLDELDAILEALRGQANERALREGIARAARAEQDRASSVLARARADVGRLGATGSVRRRRPSPSADPATIDATSRELRRAETAAVAAAERAHMAEESVAALAMPSTDDLRHLTMAVTVREARLRREVITAPPDWVRRDAATRTAPDTAGPTHDAARLAAAYGQASIEAERRGDPEATPTLLPDLLAGPTQPAARDHTLVDLLVADPAPGLADGLGL
jgi:hypothetical protein